MLIRHHLDNRTLQCFTIFVFVALDSVTSPSPPAKLLYKPLQYHPIIRVFSNIQQLLENFLIFSKAPPPLDPAKMPHIDMSSRVTEWTSVCGMGRYQPVPHIDSPCGPPERSSRAGLWRKEMPDRVGHDENNVVEVYIKNTGIPEGPLQGGAP